MGFYGYLAKVQVTSYIPDPMGLVYVYLHEWLLFMVNVW